MSKPTKTFGKMLIVDDDKHILKLLSHMFEKSYELKTAENGLLALEVLKEGFQPGVILSDQFMPEMTGSQFLAESIKIIPDSVRLILTGNSEPKDIISCINEGKAFMYLTKPFQQMDLIQAIRIAFHQFNNKADVKRINQEYLNKILNLERQLKIASSKVPETLADKGGDLKTLAKFIFNTVLPSERLFFTPHTKSVLEIGQAIATEMQLSTSSKTLQMYAAMIHNFYCISLPDYLQIVDLGDDISHDEKNLLLNHFNKILDNFTGFSELKPTIKIIARLWDFFNLETSQKTKNNASSDFESQILALANQYHNLVYRITLDQYHILLEKGEVSQTSGETLKRHEEAKNKLLRSSKIFDKDVTNAFDELIKSSNVPSLITRKETLKVTKLLEHSSHSVSTDSLPEKNYTRIKISDIETGMQVNQEINTIRGTAIVNKGEIIDAKSFSKIKQLISTGLIDENDNIQILKKQLIIEGEM